MGEMPTDSFPSPNAYLSSRTHQGPQSCHTWLDTLLSNLHGEGDLQPDGLAPDTQTPTMGEISPRQEDSRVALLPLLAATPQCYVLHGRHSLLSQIHLYEDTTSFKGDWRKKSLRWRLVVLGGKTKQNTYVSETENKLAETTKRQLPSLWTTFHGWRCVGSASPQW